MIKTWTPLLLAAKFRHKEVVKFLAEKIQDKNRKDDFGCTPLK